jgi:DNA-binding sugar fermentation-stimulating protein
MKYERIEKAVFLERENRFVAYVELEGKREKVHVKNTGRCEELLIPGAEVYLQKSENEKRATLWDLIAVKKGERLEYHSHMAAMNINIYFHICNINTVKNDTSACRIFHTV